MERIFACRTLQVYVFLFVPRVDQYTVVAANVIYLGEVRMLTVASCGTSLPVQYSTVVPYLPSTVQCVLFVRCP